MTVRRAAGPHALGLAIGSLGALAATRVLRSLRYEVTPTDPGVFALVLALLAGVGAAACLAPARRAMGMEATAAVRAE